MKKIATVLIVVLGFLSTISAQKKGDVEFGVNVGFNRSSASDSQKASDPGSGINFGGSLDYYFSNTWSIKGKLIYDQKGWDNDFIQDNNGNVYSTDVNLNYMTIPIMANWHFGKKRNWYLNFGPYLGFLLNAQETRFGTDLTDYLNTSDFGLAFGIGVKIPVSNKLKLFFEFDGQGGLSDIVKNNQYSAITNSCSSLNVGLNFLLK
jgi:hypothetical protein